MFKRQKKHEVDAAEVLSEKFDKLFEMFELDEQNEENAPFAIDFDPWIWKSNTYLRRVGLFSTFDRVKAGICVLFVLLSVYATVTDAYSPEIIASIYVITVGVWIGFDPTGAVRLHLATVTRYMVLLTVIMSVSAFWIENDNFRMMTCAVVVVTAMYVAVMNKRMLLSENWKYSEEVQHALIADPENESGEAWMHWGKVSCRTLYGNMGYDGPNKMLDANVDRFAKPVFYLVFMKCKKMYRKNDVLVQEQKEQLSEQMNVIEELQKKVESMYFDAAELDEYRIDCKILREKLANVEKENKMLVEANEYMAQNPEIVVEVTKQVECDVDKYLLMSEQERVHELFSRGYRNVDVEKATGKSKSTVSGWRKKFEEMSKETEDKK